VSEIETMLEDFTDPDKIMELRRRMDDEVKNPKPTFVHATNG
jgi:hypothetical protein